MASDRSRVVDISRWTRVEAIIEAAIDTRAFPGAVVGISWGPEGEAVRAFGRLTYADDASPVGETTLYDLASLTKVVATTPVVMKLVETGRLALDQKVSAFIPRFGTGTEISVEHLLTHSSGLPAHARFFADWDAEGRLVDRIRALPLEREPGTRSEYSDVGFLLLGEILAVLLDEGLGAVVKRTILEPLGMASTLFLPGPAWTDRIAPTEVCPWRGRLLRGEVHDENAFVLGGVAAHAGLFGSAGDLLRFGRMILAGGRVGEVTMFAAETVRRFTRRCLVPGSTRALGWDTADVPVAERSSEPGSPGYSSAGRRLSRRSFGHTGFTGTSIWIDPERDLVLVLLTNRVHPDRSNDSIREVRAALADAVAEEADRILR
jgi:CubicO group peptidase (beta-lactamase class C family)